jgi:hypothetical protein
MLPRERTALAQQREIDRLGLLINTSTVSSFLASSVLFGGTVGQVLTKLSGTDLDVSWQPAGGGGASWTEAEIDFGSRPVYEASFTITDAAITSSAVKMQVLPCGKAATGRTADDWQWDGATFAANPGTGSATVYAQFMPGPIVGRRKVQYSVGA